MQAQTDYLGEATTIQPNPRDDGWTLVDVTPMSHDTTFRVIEQGRKPVEFYAPKDSTVSQFTSPEGTPTRASWAAHTATSHPGQSPDPTFAVNPTLYVVKIGEAAETECWVDAGSLIRIYQGIPSEVCPSTANPSDPMRGKIPYSEVEKSISTVATEADLEKTQRIPADVLEDCEYKISGGGSVRWPGESRLKGFGRALGSGHFELVTKGCETSITPYEVMRKGPRPIKGGCTAIVYCPEDSVRFVHFRGLRQASGSWLGDIWDADETLLSQRIPRKDVKSELVNWGRQEGERQDRETQKREEENARSRRS
jgi:hypothetical protein